MAPRPCLEPTCPHLALSGKSRCPVHEKALQAHRNATPTRAEYATLEYKAARQAVLGQPCWRCGKPADTADHIKPVRDGGTWRDGLRPACRKCNSDYRTTTPGG